MAHELPCAPYLAKNGVGSTEAGLRRSRQSGGPDRHDRQQRLDLGDPLFGDLEEVVTQHCEVRVVTRTEDALVVLLAREPGTADGVRG
jgi:hypothetical protein